MSNVFALAWSGNTAWPAANSIGPPGGQCSASAIPLP